MLIDAHTHLDHYPPETLAAALEEIEQHQILTFSNSVDPASYRRNLEISKKSSLIVPSFGIHPWWAAKNMDRLESITPLIEQSPILGEIGLDYYFEADESTYPAQQTVFEFFLAAAQTQNKIVNLHTKGAEPEILALLDRYQIRRAIVHWYSGPFHILHQMIDRGYYFTVGVELLHTKHIQTIAQKLPPERLLTETDNPDGYEWFSGLPGMPRHLNDVVAKLAALKQTTPQAIRQTVQQNLLRLIDNDPHFSKFAAIQQPGSA